MPWKTIKGIKYFYAPLRVDGRVRYLYAGNGEFARNLAKSIEDVAGLASMGKTLAQHEREHLVAEERAISEWFTRIDRLASAAMICAGYHKHHRSEWRKTRHVP